MSKKKKDLTKISREQLLKFWKKASRELGLETPFSRGGRHETDKKDIFRKSKNTIRKWEDD